MAGFTLGLLLFFHHRLRTLASLGESYFLGLLLLMLAAATWAGYGLAQKQLLKQVSANELLLLAYVAGQPRPRAKFSNFCILEQCSLPRFYTN